MKKGNIISDNVCTSKIHIIAEFVSLWYYHFYTKTEAEFISECFVNFAV